MHSIVEKTKKSEPTSRDVMERHEPALASKPWDLGKWERKIFLMSRVAD